MYTITYTYMQAKKRTPRSPSTPVASAASLRFTSRQLLALFRRLLPQRELWKLPSLKGGGFYRRLFTPVVTLWYLIFQRLGFDSTLQNVVVDALAGGANSLRRGLSKKLRSTRTTSFSDARQRVPLAFLVEALVMQGRKILGLNEPVLWHGLAVRLLDGTTVRLRPHGGLSKTFTPQSNQSKSPPYWCLMRAVACFCAHSGAALACALGDRSIGEQALACQLIPQILGACLYVGDRNFGVFRMVQAVRATGAHALFRLTDARARSLLGRAPTSGTFAISWRPTQHDQLPEDCSREPVAGRILIVQVQRPGYRTQRICLFTTLTDEAAYPLQEIVTLYGIRWQVELNLRYLKDQMRLAQLDAKSADMAQKEWYAGLMAYNLIRAAMLCAGLQQGISPLTLSFSASRRYLQDWLSIFGQGGSGLAKAWDTMLIRISRSPLPTRRKIRPNEPRKQRHVREPYPPLIGSRAKARRKVGLEQRKPKIKN